MVFCLLSFAFSFMYYNSDVGFDTGSGNFLNNSKQDMKTQLLAVNDESNLLLNITAQTDPEVSQLGSRDSVATSYGYRKQGVSNWDKFKVLLFWVFSGDAGKVLISVLGGIIGFLSLYYIIKFIRTGS